MHATPRDPKQRSYAVTFSHTVLVSGATPNTAREAVERLHHGAVVSVPVPAKFSPAASEAYHEWISGEPEDEQGYDVSLRSRELATLLVALEVGSDLPNARDIDDPLTRGGDDSELACLVAKLDNALDEADSSAAGGRRPATGTRRLSGSMPTPAATAEQPTQQVSATAIPKPVRSPIPARERWADLVRIAMKSTTNATGAPVTLRQLSKAVGFSYERTRTAVAGVAPFSKSLNDCVCKYLGLDADHLWHLAQAEKLQKKYGAAMANIPKDQRLADLWERLGETERNRIIHIAEAYVMAEATPARREPQS